MEIKKSKVLSNAVAEWATPDTYGNLIYTIKLEDGAEGWFRTKNPDYFKVGEEANYILEVKAKADGSGNNTWIKKPTKDQMEEAGIALGGGGGSYKGGGGSSSKWEAKKKVAYMADMVSYGMRYATDLLIAGKLPEGSSVGDMGPLLTKAMWKTLNEIEGLE